MLPPTNPSLWQNKLLLIVPGTDVAIVQDSTDNKPTEPQKSENFKFSSKGFSLDIPAQELREEIGDIAREAAESFANACRTSNPTEAENKFASVSVLIKELWNYSAIRDLPFRDLLAAIDAAIRHRVLQDFDLGQRDAIALALRRLCHWRIGFDDVDEIIKRFVSQKIDLMRPITNGKRKRKWKVTVTEISENDNTL
jgi:hypothetical protein